MKTTQELLNQKDVFLLLSQVEEDYGCYKVNIIPNDKACREIVGEKNIFLKGKYWCLVRAENITLKQIDKLGRLKKWLLDDLDNLYAD